MYVCLFAPLIFRQSKPIELKFLRRSGDDFKQKINNTDMWPNFLQVTGKKGRIDFFRIAGKEP